MTLAELTQLIDSHDMTYAYSDDHRYWRAGEASWAKIMDATKLFPQEVTQKIWNAKVDREIREDYRHEWYWRLTNTEATNDKAGTDCSSHNYPQAG